MSCKKKVIWMRYLNAMGEPRTAKLPLYKITGFIAAPNLWKYLEVSEYIKQRAESLQIDDPAAWLASALTRGEVIISYPYEERPDICIVETSRCSYLIDSSFYTIYDIWPPSLRKRTKTKGGTQ